MRNEAELAALAEDCRLIIRTLARTAPGRPEDVLEVAAVCLALDWAAGKANDRASKLMASIQGFAGRIRAVQSAHEKAGRQ